MSRGSCVDSVQETVNDDSHGAFNLVDALVGGGDAAVRSDATPAHV